MYRVVIVEDDRIIRKSIVQANWNEINAKVVGEAPDGEQGIEVIEKTNPQLVVTDINMPFMDGITFAKRIREIDPSVRIIFLTGYDNFEYVHEAVLLKSDDYLLKPIDNEILLEKANLALTAWLEENEKQEKLLATQPLLQQSFLSQVIFNSNEVGQTDIQHELLKLGIFLAGPDYQILNIRVQDFPKQESLYQLLKEWQMDTEIEILSFQYNEVFIILSVDKNNIDWVSRFQSDIMQSLSVKYKNKVYLTQSNVYSEQQEIEQGIIEAKSKMEYNKMKNSVDELHELSFTDNLEEYIDQVKSYLNVLRSQELQIEEVKRFIFSIVIYLCIIFNKDTKVKSEQLNQFEIGQDVLQSNTISEVLSVVESLIKKIESSNVESELKDSSESIVYQALSYIEQHFTDSELSLVNVANEIHVTPPYLSNLFKEKTGRNFTEYLVELRMEKAKELLETTQLRVQEIAEEIGYLNPHYFSSSFKRYSGNTPLEYRKKIKK